MKLKALINLLIIICSAQVMAQLSANCKKLHVGNVDAGSAQKIIIPIFNQSHSSIRVTSFIPGNNSGRASLPEEIASYGKDRVIFSTNRPTKGKFLHKVFLEGQEGTLVLTVRGKYGTSVGNQDCADFSKSKLKIKRKGRYFKGDLQTDLVRVYDSKNANKLFCADPNKLSPAHVIFLLDASGSMGEKDKLEMIKGQAMAMIEELRPDDHVSIMRYSEGSEMIISKTPCSEIDQISTAIDEIEAGGFTDGMSGINSALAHSRKTKIAEQSNQILLLTDGAFNLGEDNEGIRRLLLGESKSMDYRLSIISIGSDRGNKKDMKILSRAGNGYYFTLDEGIDRKKINKLLIKQLST